jgi:hypothetical protein
MGSMAVVAAAVALVVLLLAAQAFLVKGITVAVAVLRQAVAAAVLAVLVVRHQVLLLVLQAQGRQTLTQVAVSLMRLAVLAVLQALVVVRQEPRTVATVVVVLVTFLTRQTLGATAVQVVSCFVYSQRASHRLLSLRQARPPRAQMVRTPTTPMTQQVRSGSITNHERQ